MPLEVTGAREALARHQRAATRARDLSPLLAEFRGELEAMVARAWAQERSPGGEAWAPRERASESTGRLRMATQVIATRDTLEITVGSQHASFQFFGTRTIPARNPLPVEPGPAGLVWVQRGEAGAWIDAMVARAEAYLAAGEP